MSRYELISFDLCPFVQKAAIALQARGVAYEVTYIDLYAERPDWFKALSPYGKVPVLKVGDRGIFESSVINEYIEDTAEGEPLFSADPFERAHERAWVIYASDLNGPTYRLMVAEDSAEAGSEAEQVRQHMTRLEAHLDADGPWFKGETFTLIDVAVAPPLQRLLWIDALAPKLKLFAKAPKVRAWATRLVAHPAVQASTVPDVHDRFLSYLKGKGSPTRDVAASWLGRQAG